MVHWLRVAVALAALLASSAAQTETPMRGVLTTPGGDLPFVMSEILGPYRIYHGAQHQAAVVTPSAAGQCTIVFAPYDSRLQFLTGGSYPLRGTWQKVGPTGEIVLPFRWEPWPLVVDQKDPGRRHNGPLFDLAGEPTDVSGRWRVQFEHDPQPAVAIFEPSRGPFVGVPGEVQGTFLTVTGDYRYLAGTARGGELRLSCFDGAHAFLFAAKLQADGTLAGDFWSGASGPEHWTARRDANAALPDAFALTKARVGASLRDLHYPDAADGKERRVGNELGTATVVVLFGTWCPNCNDAGPFLRELLQQHGERGLRVLGLAFEHGNDVARQRRVIADYRRTHAVSWPILLAGSSDKKKASEAIPVLDAVRAFPTTLFVDAAGTIRAVHQGFAGPATGDAYQAQRRTFTEQVEHLLTEGAGKR